MQLLTYAEAAEQVHRFIQAMADGVLPGETGPRATDTQAAFEGVASRAKMVSLAEASGRVLAEPLHADRDQPPFPRATRDGFACRAAEASTNQLLFLAGHLGAGDDPAAIGLGKLGAGEVWEIMTGAPVPDGADAVFMVEHSEHASNFVRLAAPRTLQPGENIVPRGSEARAGDLLIPLGVRLGPAQIALAAQCGYASLRVAVRPRVAILATGDELVSVEETPRPSQIRNSNAPMLAALVAAAGGEPLILPAVPDQDGPLDAAIQQALAADLLLVSGGISAGRFDLVEGALTRAGARFFFGGVAIQPGKPIVFGQLPRQGRSPLPFFALPGNPISSAVTFHLFAAPLLAALAEDSTPSPCFALAELTTEWRGKPGLTRFLPAWCDFALEPEVRLIPWQGSGDIAAFARSNCFLVVPAEAQEIASGSIVQILLI
ncbi:MAG TPA: gephyrin-like molybdotransferase Glp [Acidobacteriaceae bacterium]|nr:gephyrin-like molybdotransferase Glp [Acidobacteriaceae bacterium]